MTRKAAAGRGTIGQRSDGLWRGSVMVDGRRRYVHAKLERDVVAKLDALRATLTAGQEPTPARLTVGRYLDDWLKTVKPPELRPSTFRSYSGHVRLYIKPAIGAVPLARLTPAHVRGMLNDLRGRGLSPTTVLHVRSTLRAALAQAEEDRKVPNSVARLRKQTRRRGQNVSRTPVRYMTEEQVRAFLAATRDTPQWPLYVVAVSAGLRQGELLGLAWADIDRDAGTLKVRRSLQMVDGRPELLDTKTESSDRDIALSQAALGALSEQRRRQLEDRLAAGPGWEGERWGFVFADRWGEPLRPWAVTRQYQAHLAAASLPRFRFHDLRHTAATLLLGRGVGPRVVMETLGHSTITTTMNIYAHVMQTQQREAADRMDEVLAAR